MATTPVEFFAPSGLTLTVDLFPFGSDTRANGSGDSATEATNRKGLYSFDVTEALEGWHTSHVFSGAKPIGRFAVNLHDTTNIHRESSIPDPANPIPTESTNMRGTDNAMLAANYVAPDNATIGNIWTAVQDLVLGVGSIFNRLAGITSLANWLRAFVRNGEPDATAISEINVGGGTFSPETDSLEAIRDRGDVAWTGGGGFNPTTDEVESGVTYQQAIQRIGASAAGKVSGAGTGTETFVGLDGATDRLRITVDNQGNRTDVESDPS